MTTFVDLSSFEEQASGLIAYFNILLKQHRGEDAPKFTESQKTADEAKLKEILTNLISNQGLVFQEAQEKEIENCFNVICSLLRKLDIVSVDELAKKLIENVVSDKTDRPLLRLKILNNLYNMFDSDSISRYEVFMSILQYALDSNNTEVVIPHFKNIDEWIKTWATNTEQTRKIYRLVSHILQVSNKSLQAYHTLIKYLRTFESTDEEALVSAKEAGVRAASQAIKLSEVNQFDELLEIPAIKQLQSDPVHSKLYELLQLFAHEKLESFTNFHKNNPDYLESVGISHDDSLKKIRLLSIATLAVESNEIPYSKIAQTLMIEEEEVEGWVVLAISAKLIDAKMNQVKRIVIVSQSTYRMFTQDQWKQLKSQVVSWQKNIQSLLVVVRSNEGPNSFATLAAARS
jgi:translation initiation factor 3 subunit M